MKPRPIRIEGDIAYVPLSQGAETIIDACDVPLVENHNWHLRRKYVVCHIPQKNGKYLYIHRVIAGTPDGLLTDHISGNTLDNRRCNLRWATTSQNGANVPASRSNTSGRKGVCWHKSNKKWQARIRVNRKRISLGLFDDIEEAAEAYAKAAEKYFGEFARAEAIRQMADEVKP